MKAPMFNRAWLTAWVVFCCLILVACQRGAAVTPTPTVTATVPSAPEQAIRFLTSTGTRQNIRWGQWLDISKPGAEEPQAAVTPGGVVHVVWVQNTVEAASGTVSRLMYRQLTHGAWGDPQVLAIGPASNLRLAADAQGQLHLLWASPDPCPYGECENTVCSEGGCGSQIVWYQRRSIGGSWTQPEDITKKMGTGVWPQSIAIALGPDGTLHMVWGQYPQDNGLQYSERRTNGTWSAPEVAVPAVQSMSRSGMGREFTMASLVVDSRGAAYVAWGDNLTGTGQVYIAERQPGRGWSKPQVVFRFQDGWATPKLASLLDGKLALLIQIAWDVETLGGGGQRGGESNAYFFMTKDSDGAWSVPETVPGLGQEAPFSSLASDQDGRVYITWSDNPGNFGHGLAAFRDAGGPSWSFASALPTGEAVYEPQVLSLGNGKVLVIARTAPPAYPDQSWVTAMDGYLSPWP